MQMASCQTVFHLIVVGYAGCRCCEKQEGVVAHDAGLCDCDVDLMELVQKRLQSDRPAHCLTLPVTVEDRDRLRLIHRRIYSNQVPLARQGCEIDVDCEEVGEVDAVADADVVDGEEVRVVGLGGVGYCVQQ